MVKWIHHEVKRGNYAFEITIFRAHLSLGFMGPNEFGKVKNVA